MVRSGLINIAKHNHGATQNIKKKARDLRNEMTGPEKILWGQIRARKQNSMFFRRQHPYRIYILDFYCFEANLAIEVDGKIHLGRQDYDLERTEYLQSSDLKVLRFKNMEIETRIDLVLKKINSFSDN